jgi:hypothetical protein
MAHFREAWVDPGPLLFVTLTLRPGDAERLTAPERIAALRTLFRSRLLRRMERAEGVRPRYVAQVDVGGSGTHHHLHAVLETTIEPASVVGAWVASGGGLDHDAQVVGASLDDIVRTVGYVVKGSRWPGHGNLMNTRSLGYSSHEAKARRAAYRERRYPGQQSRELFLPFEPDMDTSTRSARRVTKPKLAPVRLGAPTPTETFSPVLLRGASYGLVSRYDAATERATVTAAEGSFRGSRRVLVASNSSKVVLRQFLDRYDARRRQRLGNRAPRGERSLELVGSWSAIRARRAPR